MEEKDYRKKIRQFKCRLAIEAGIRAGTIGLAVGLSCMAAVLLYGRLCCRKIMLVEAGMAAVLGLVVMLACYVFWLRPRKKEVLARIDGLGLQERMITMEELRQEDTVLAKLQRNDTKVQLEKLNVKSLRLRLYIIPLFYSLAMAVMVILLIVLPLPEPPEDEQAEKNAQEMQLVDELIAALSALVDAAEITDSHKTELQEIIEALEVSFTPEDSTLTRTAKIATASKRLDLYEASEQNEVTLLKQQAGDSEAEQEKVSEAKAEQKRLSQTVKDMKDLMGTSIDVLNQVEGTFWTPAGPTSGTSYDVETLPTEEEPAEGEEPPEGEEPGEEGEPQDGMEPGEDGEPQEGMEGSQNGAGSEKIFDPEQGEVSYGSVYETYYQEILKALTEREFSEEIREIIEDYANSLE